MNIKRGLATLAIAALSLTSLAACGSDTAQDEEKPDSLSFWYYEEDDAGQTQAWRRAAKAFEKETGVKINFERKSFTQIAQNGSQFLNSDEAPDLMESNRGNGSAGVLSTMGLLTDLGDYVKQYGWDKKVTGANAAVAKYDENGIMDGDTWYGMTSYAEFQRVYYNKDLFDKAGVEYPSNDLTMEDYDALARKMTSGSGDTKVYGCHYHTWRSAASLFSILDGKNTIIDGKYDFMKPTYDMVIAQQKDGICMDYGYLKTSSLHYSAAFENQQCAMVNMGSWFISTLEAYMKDAETKFNWGIVKYPHPAGAEAGSTLGTVTSLAINADSPKAEAAADFINWCVSEEGAQAIAKTGTFPACGSAATAEIIKSTEGFPEDSNSVDALTTSNVYLEMPYTQYASDIETILNAEHDAIMTMSETVDEGIQNMNDQVPAVLG